jgi:hypothetical protein
MAQRQQLSAPAAQTLKTMIQNRTASLREQLRVEPTPEEARAAFKARIEAHLGRPLPESSGVK